ncbi:MAG: aminotransferase class I/II-fold pyridoxal phosphate-dependent enzyme [Coriobacteriia bacterium]|jgi:cystathionine beta-lyase|nr:aminotransferase class I/II-fold pyridoxal phosphate-dependent enzyme [Coriobacteriia bacterium]
MSEDKAYYGHTGGDSHGSFAADVQRLHTLTSMKWTLHGPEVIPAWVADMDLPPAPPVLDAVRALVDRGDFGYNFDAAHKLPEVFAERQARLFGWRPDIERLRLFCDVMQAVQTALWLATKPGDGVVVFTPVYPPFLNSVDKTGRRIVECPLDRAAGWRLDRTMLDSVVDERTRVILLCHPHNPTGRVFDDDELAAIAYTAERHDLLVVSDEIWADLTYPPARFRPFAAVSEEAASRTLTLSAASKAFNVAGLRCAIAHVGDARVAEGLGALPDHLLGAVGSPGAEATLAAWTKGDGWLAATREHLVAQRDHLARRLAFELPEVGFAVPEATYLAWLDLRELGLGDNPAAWLLEHARVALSSGPDFGERGRGYARLNFATTRSVLDEIIDRIVTALRAR